MDVKWRTYLRKTQADQYPLKNPSEALPLLPTRFCTLLATALFLDVSLFLFEDIPSASFSSSVSKFLLLMNIALIPVHIHVESFSFHLPKPAVVICSPDWFSTFQKITAPLVSFLNTTLLPINVLLTPPAWKGHLTSPERAINIFPFSYAKPLW